MFTDIVLDDVKLLVSPFMIKAVLNRDDKGIRAPMKQVESSDFLRNFFFRRFNLYL
jgi:hypothetical protein